MGKRVRLIDLADHCGLAVSSVCEIMRNPEDARYPLQTRRKVRTAAGTLGYQPNVHARALLTGRTGVVGVSCGRHLDLNWAKAVDAAETVVSGRGHHMLLHIREDVTEWDNLLAQNQVDFIAALVHPELLDHLAATKRELRGQISIVVGSRARTSLTRGVRSYTWDETAAARHAVEYLIGRGHRHIAVLQGAKSDRDQKVIGAKQALTLARLPLNVATVASEQDRLTSARKLAAMALEKDPETTAIFCRTSVLAPGVYAELRSRGLRIPEDLSVVAQYDHQDVLALDPPLTCVHVPIVEATCQALEDYFSKVVQAGSVPFDTRLVERSSVASIKGAPAP